MNFLAIDTVFDKCSVAILANGDIIYHAEQMGKRQQTQQILPMIDEALHTAKLQLSDFDALVFNQGPGAFSGIRINTAVVQALSFAHDIPCIGISSLQIVAQVAHEQHEIIQGYAVIDARMKQVYLGEYQLEDGIMQLVKQETLLDYDEPTEENKPLFCLATDDKSLVAVQDEQKVLDMLRPTAETLAKLGAKKFEQKGGVSAEQALPVYLRNNAWKTLKEQGKK